MLLIKCFHLGRNSDAQETICIQAYLPHLMFWNGFLMYQFLDRYFIGCHHHLWCLICALITWYVSPCAGVSNHGAWHHLHVKGILFIILYKPYSDPWWGQLLIILQWAILMIWRMNICFLSCLNHIIQKILKNWMSEHFEDVIFHVIWSIMVPPAHWHK